MTAESRIAGQRTGWMHVLLILAALLVLIPVVWVGAAGFKTQISLLMGEIRFTPHLRNFEEVLFSRTSDYVRNFRNSLLIASSSTLLCLVVATLAAYSIQRMLWRRTWIIHTVLLWALLFHMIPPIALAGAWFVMFRTIGLDNTFLAIILAHATINLPMALWLIGVFVAEVPKELEEAAKIDGASTPVLLRSVVVPLIMPGLMATAVLVFVFSWNEFPVALALSMRETATVPVAIAKYAQEYEIKYTEMAASATLSIVPALILLLVGQRYIVKGITAGAVK